VTLTNENVNFNNYYQSALNLVTAENSYKPNYSLKGKDIYLEIWISPVGEVCLISRVDNNYLCGLSMTNIDEIEQNMKIIGGMLHDGWEMTSDECSVLGDRYHTVSQWFSYNIVKQYDDEIKKTIYTSTLGIGFPQEKYQAELIAGNIKSAFKDEQYKGEFLAADGKMKKVLKWYKDQTSSMAYQDESISLINDLLDKLNCLRLCKNESVRELYLETVELWKDLYDKYMNRVR
jgi:hypothetical protein